MAAILKHGTVEQSVRPLRAVTPPPAAVVDPLAEERAAARAERERLHAEIAAVKADARRAASEAETRTKAMVEAARAEGERAGATAAQDRADARLAALTAGIATQTADLRRHFADADALAAILATAAIDRLFGADAPLAAMVAATLSRNAARLRDEAVVAVAVSAADFADREVLDAAVAALGDGVAVSIDARLPPGACRATVRLGAIDLDVRQQWAQLAEALR